MDKANLSFMIALCTLAFHLGAGARGKCLLRPNSNPQFYDEFVVGHGWLVRSCAAGTRFSALNCRCSLYLPEGDDSDEDDDDDDDEADDRDNEDLFVVAFRKFFGTLFRSYLRSRSVSVKVDRNGPITTIVKGPVVTQHEEDRDDSPEAGDDDGVSDDGDDRQGAGGGEESDDDDEEDGVEDSLGSLWSLVSSGWVHVSNAARRWLEHEDPTEWED